MPVKARFFNHFIMPALLKVPQPGFNKHHEVNNNPGENMEAMETCYPKKISTKRNGTRKAHGMALVHHSRNRRTPRIVRDRGCPFFYFTIDQNGMCAC